MNRQVAKWTVGKLGSDKTPQLNGTIVLIPNSENVTEEAPPIQMHWKVPMASVSGMFSPFVFCFYYWESKKSIPGYQSIIL